MQRSTKLKIAMVVGLVLTLVGTVVASILIPPAAPAIAGVGSAMTIAAGQEVSEQLIARCFDRLFSSSNENTDDDDPESRADLSQHNHWMRVTEEQAKSKSGYHFTKVVTLEEKSDCNNKHKLKL